MTKEEKEARRMKIELIHGDCLEEMKNMEDNSIDLVLTDPPYGLEFMGKDWDKGVPGVHFWVEMLRVLKPGGYLLSFSGTRTYHRMGTAIEDAGFEVRDMIEWVYGSGFPKSLNIGKAVDKLQGNEREVVDNPYKNRRPNGNAWVEQIGDKPDEYTKGNSEWEGWGTALKPAHEPICMARKPLAEKTVALNVLKYGTGGINIDESRVGTEVRENPQYGNGGDLLAISKGGEQKWDGTKETVSGRFPANLIHDGSDEVKECFPDESERFFKSIIYQAKASKSERNRGCDELEEKVRVRQGLAGEKKDTISTNSHPTVKPVALMEYLAKMCSTEGAVVLDPFMGSGTTGVACKKLNRNFIGIELDPEYFEIAKKRIG